jgi:chemotaxis signal transduction protein
VIQNQSSNIPFGNGETHPTQTLRLFRVGSFQLGIFEDEIATTVEWREPAPLPHAPKSVLGVVSIQGRMLTVLDPAILLGEEVASGTPHSHILALRGDEQLALAADDIGGLAEMAASDYEPGGENSERLILGAFQHEGTTISIINVKQLFASAIQGRERRRRRF